MNVATVLVKAKTLQTIVLKYKHQIIGWDLNVVKNTELKIVQKELEDQKHKLISLYESLCDVGTADEMTANDPLFNTLFDAVHKQQIHVGELIAAREKAKLSAFKLDKIKLPTFNGAACEWQSYYDLFKSSVDTNPNLSGAEKMVHLKSSLTGEAAFIVSSFPATDASYKQAWDLVIKRYSNKREIIFAHIRKFEELKPNLVESASSLRTVTDTINECVRSLTSMSVPVDKWDLIMIYLALKKLSVETRKEWLLHETNVIPTLDKFIAYLELRARALADSENSSKKPGSSSGNKKSCHVSSSSLACPKCSEPHHLHKCKIFLESNLSERKDLVSKKQLCFNCLFPSHSASKCKMDFSCRKCGRRHHTLLHTDQVMSKSSGSSSSGVEAVASRNVDNISSGEPISVSSSHSTHKEEGNSIVLMGTLMVSVKDSSGVLQNCRVFVDPGSESNFITEFCVDRLNLKRKKTCISVSGISGSVGEIARGIVKPILVSNHGNFTLPIDALILKKITNNLPRVKCNFNWPHLKGLILGDPSFNVPGTVDILIGAEVAASIMLPGIKLGPLGTPSAQNTQFGWMLSGSVYANCKNSYHLQTYSNHSSCHSNEPCIESTMSKFWELEEPEVQARSLSEEDTLCQNHFVTTHLRNADGRYIVELPFKSTISSLGTSREAAVQRFTRVEKRLAQNQGIKEEYIKCMREAISSNFLELVPPDQVTTLPSESYYMPHREVVKESSTSTKVRIVFDASAKSSSGASLNDLLMTGPKLQADLVPLLIRFRAYKIAISADIVKFYPQFLVNRKHVDYQRLVWREDPSHPLQDYRMLRITFGVTSAPYLAIRCLHQLAEDEEKFTLASNVIKNDFLVDNLLSGADNEDAALALQTEILEVMERGKLSLRKWSSNNINVVNAVPLDHRESEFPLSIKEDEALKTIGLLWNPGADCFGISIDIPEILTPMTKRKVLSSIAKTFDPLGWLSPVTVSPKILMQTLWKEKLDWDAPIPDKLGKIWINYCKDLILLKSFRINRCLVGPGVSQEYELHGFSDASLLAYAACVYLKTLSSNGNYVNLIIAKTKVCPLKQETIPRLELCAAVLLSKLIKMVMESIKIKFRSIRCWTDSTIVIDWLNSSKKLEIFVANRVRIIKSIIPSQNWCHVEGEENPADAPSRGISSLKFLSTPIWLCGPSWLLSEIPMSRTSNESNYSAVIMESSLSSFINKCSSYSKMKRVIGFVLRFVNNVRVTNSKRMSGVLTVSELNQALQFIVLQVQRECFQDEIDRLKTNLIIKSRVKFLTPFLDSYGLLRVGGRLSNSQLPYDQKHPFLLPRNHHFTEVLVRYYHLTYLHAGSQLILSLVRQRFWIVRGSDTVRRIIHRCVVCHRQERSNIHQLMGQLPSSRVTVSKPFSNTGMDYAGPFYLCLAKGRNPKIIKHYVSIFVCMATKAIHLELVGDLTTPSFVSALTRFVSRRGLPTDVYCDGGTNFLGAKNEMDSFSKLMKSTSHQQQINDFWISQEIRYHFNPPLSPHHGGLWEAGVKSMKTHLKKVVEDRHLSIEEFSTLLCQVEACLNSRPITQLSTDPADFGVLTPGHFLTGDALLSLPQHDLTDVKMNRLTRWQLVQQMSQHFWKRWNSDYLHTLQSRPKWFVNQPDLSTGVLVLIRDDEPTWGPLKWKLGRISATQPGPDGKVRVCDVTTSNGKVYRRPIVKLSPLPIYH